MGILGKTIKKVASFLPESVRDGFSFELRSFIGRHISKDLILDPNRANYINLGAGKIIHKEFINIDFFFSKDIDYGLDLRYPLRITSSSIDGIVSEHTFEHLCYQDADNLLKECYRIMKKGALFRLIVPDLSLFLKKYYEKDQQWFDRWEKVMFIDSGSEERNKRRLATMMEAISFTTQEYGHISCWDFETCEYFLRKNGFKDIGRQAYREGRNDKLLIDTNNEGRRLVSLYVEAIK